MYCEEQTELKQRMKDAGVTIKAISKRLKKPYSTIGGMLGGFTPMTEYVQNTIKTMIQESLILRGKK
jgi:hypothetical protein